MNFLPNTEVSLLAIGLLVVVTSEAIASDESQISETLKSHGVSCTFDDDDNLVSVDFGWMPTSVFICDDLPLLRNLGHLIEVKAYGLELGDEGFKHLASLSQLKRLDLSGTKCTDADIELFAGLLNLEELALGNTAVTDASVTKFIALHRFNKFQKLKGIELSSTRITQAGLTRLRRELPHLHISERWSYYAGIMDGRGMLALDHAIIYFTDITGSKAASAGIRGFRCFNALSHVWGTRL
jgi:hypothetical protein